MCIITTEELEAEQRFWLNINKTSIFSRHIRPGYQVLVYSMSITSSSAAAMILPIPVSVHSGDDAVRFIDLSGYPDFFTDMKAGCEPECDPIDFLSFSDDLGESEVAETVLTVHEVGDYDASYVPKMADFTRLDPRFRLSEEIWKKMPDYSNYGFAVFQLKITLTDENVETENDAHPMAFEFPTRDDERLFYPTVHVHDGDFHNRANYYHNFYCQRDNARSEFKYQRDLLERLKPSPAEEINKESGFWGYEWFSRSVKQTSQIMNIEQSTDLVAIDKKIHNMSLYGNYPNKDIWLGDSL